MAGQAKSGPVDTAMDGSAYGRSEGCLHLEGEVSAASFGTVSLRVRCGDVAQEKVLSGKLEISGLACQIVLLFDSTVRACQGRVVTFHEVDFAWDRGCLYLIQKKLSAVVPVASGEGVCILETVELCSGIGALGIGLAAAGFHVSVVNDRQAPTLHAATEACNAVGVLGDINDPQVVAAIHQAAPCAGTVAAGVSCQPFSRLGDRKGPDDDRCQSLLGTLRAGFLLGVRIIILECVVQAGQHQWVQEVLKAFCEATGYALAQLELDLAQVWVSSRKRWWAVLTHAAHPIRKIAPWMPHGPWRAVRDVVPLIHSSSTDPRLRLSSEEVQVFERFKRLEEYAIDLKRAAPTALHAWGNQLTGCPCGCRSSGLSATRLLSQGLHARIVQESGGSWRFLSGEEVAILNGMPPLDIQIEPRLHLALIGQLASPLQSGWVGASVLCSLKVQGLDVPAMDPLLVLHAQRRFLLRVSENLALRPAEDSGRQNGTGVQAQALLQVSTRITNHVQVLGAKDGAKEGAWYAMLGGSRSSGRC